MSTLTCTRSPEDPAHARRPGPWRHLRPRWPRDEPEPPAGDGWLLRLLLCKLMLSSGLTKVAWGDRTWRDLTALAFHYWTQPLPTGHYLQEEAPDQVYDYFVKFLTA